ncbi:hypothetical protein K435DRAFT_965845 [Dendrothele bispora CBS 962.96]|uniref:F-box domain-containing protein n=1 Tax=Dendrothele bispora (strain CBS 962.96) TaxID=1314807 RepID=A0A4V4HFY7_DENBC|nr:hypothetical protein K435DRAFT_965845 [Dendrothele bispora CBS 962.96]
MPRRDLPTTRRVLRDRANINVSYNQRRNSSSSIAKGGQVVPLLSSPRGGSFDVHPPDLTIPIVQRLPFDVLSEIFENCIFSNYSLLEDSDARRKGRPFWVIKNSPWVLSQVCAHWRVATQRLRNLWTHVQIDAYKESDLTSSSRAQLLALFLERSGDAELDVFVNCKIPDVEDNVIYPTLLQHSHRFRFLSFKAPPRCLRYFKPIQGNLRSLRKLRLFIIHPGKTPRKVVQLFSDAPLLENVKIRESGDRQRFAFRAHQLREVVAPISAISDLRLLTTLKECKLFINKSSWVLMKGKTLNSSSLCSLSLEEPFLLRAGNLARLLNSLVLPSLVSLSIRTRDKTNLCSSIGSFLLRSQCRLTNLDIEVKHLEPDDLEQLFHLCPGLLRLRLSTRMKRSIIQLFHRDPSGSDTCLLPRLETLDMSASRFKSESYLPHDFFILCRTIWLRGFEDDVDLQTTGLVRLKELHVHTRFEAGKASHKVKRMMTALAEKGLNIYLRGNLLSLADLRTDSPCSTDVDVEMADAE